MVLVGLLELQGHRVTVAQNGCEASLLASQEAFDVCLMDLDMPVIGGDEATRTLRMCGFSAPILALTAHRNEGERLRALAAGCNSVIEKPLTRSSLLVALSAALAPNVAGVAVGK